jgi:hypothetical protein
VSSGRPRAYAREKLPALRARWRNPAIHAALARWAPHWLPGVPLPAVLGLTASSEGPTEWAGRRGTDLSERGLYNTEDTTLSRWHADATTLREFGHAVDLGPSFARDHEAQAYLGLRRYRQVLDSARAAMAVEVEPSVTPLDVWALYVAAMAFSQGAGRPPALVRVYPWLAQRAPGDRVRALRTALVRDTHPIAQLADGRPRTTIGGVRSRGKWGAMHSAVRAEQRIESGLLLARTLDPAVDVTWWGSAPYLSPADDAVEIQAARQAYAT